jgi:hypothetical protein
MKENVTFRFILDCYTNLYLFGFKLNYLQNQKRYFETSNVDKLSFESFFQNVEITLTEMWILK